MIAGLQRIVRHPMPASSNRLSIRAATIRRRPATDGDDDERVRIHELKHRHDALDALRRVLS